jgi:hypothetical protein
MNEFLISIDIDWAPDFAIEQVAQELIDNNVKCTWFVTHNSPAVKKLAQNNLFELGIHPNFLPGSSHGNNADEIIKYCLDIVPNAKSIRTHTLHQSSGLLKKIREDHGMLVDSSIYLPYAKNIEPHLLSFSHNSKPLTRIPYFWEDDAECYRADKNWDFNNEKLFVKGLKIFNFHPTYIYLNVDEMHDYERLKMEKCSKKPLYDVEEVEMAEYKNKGKGAGELFNNLVNYMAKNQPISNTISEIYEAYNKI